MLWLGVVGRPNWLLCSSSPFLSGWQGLTLLEFVEGVAGRVAGLSCLLERAIRLVRGKLAGRWLSELARDEAAAAMLLGGLEPALRGEPYGRRSLARFYRDIVGVGLSHPRLVALRIDDGLDLVSAGRGVRVRGFETRFSKLLSTLCSVSSRLAGRVEAGGDVEEALEDPEWIPRRLEELLRVLVTVLPPYSPQATVVAAVARGVPAELAEANPYGDLEPLMVERVEVDGLSLVRAVRGGPAHLFTCLAYTGWKLLQLRELQNYYTIPDPFADLVNHAWRRDEVKGAKLLEQLVLYGKTAQCLDPLEDCKAEPPCLPQGYRLVKVSGKVIGEKLELPGLQLEIRELIANIAPLAATAAAWLEPGPENTIAINYIYTPYPPAGTLQSGTGEGNT